MVFFLPTRSIAPSFTVVTTKPRVITCPIGYILVPGNPSYKTQDFCVMKYDAKCSNPDPKCVTSEGVYDNALGMSTSASADSHKNNGAGCECVGNFQVISKPDGAPITFIPEDDGTKTSAKAYCENINAHLINNNEWMTIARNVEQVSANWCNRDGSGCGNVPGTPGKILANGHNDSKPNKALPAGSDNQPNFMDDQKRTLTLSNDRIIWDFAGNVWQWVDATIPRKDEPRSITPNLGGSGWVWAEFQTVKYSNDFAPSNPNWNSTQGVGRIYHYNLSGDTDSTLYTYIRGGNWRHGYDSGAFTIHMQPVPDKTNIDDVGFRCVTSPLE